MAYTKGNPAPNRGKPHTEETKKKISELCKKASVGKWNIGLTRTEEHKRQISEGLIEYFKKQEHRN
jgi:hypothetical protein